MKTKAIIPCAGFGTRMGMKPNESKEMLKDPYCDYNEEKFIIDHSLYVCKVFDLEPLIITRKEKKDLIKYLKKKNIDYILVDHKGEWNQTVLFSKNYWNENNILILPDTRFSFHCIQNIKNGLELGNNAVFAVHKVKDPQNWGIIDDYSIFEKPSFFKEEKYAWGIIGFNKWYGEILFREMKNGLHLNHCGFTYLEYFEDITRGKK